jgi:probable O-glycosylation ligase (exosortase A-associated)
MRDIALLCILLAFCWLALLKPWLGVLGLAVLGYMQPQGYAAGFMRQVPVFMVLFGITSLSLIHHVWREKSWAALPWQRLLAWQVLLLLGLWLWFAVTSYFAVMPWEAWDKYLVVLKILPPLLLTLLLIDSREKLRYLIITIALSILLPAIKGGYWAVASGFQDRVYGPPGSAYADNNAFAIAVAMAIPLLVLWWRESHDKGLRIALFVGIALAYGSVLSSWSRGGMLALGAITLLLVWHSKRKLLAIPLLLAMGAVFFVQLPEKWFGRMETVATYEADASAQSRLAVWQVGFDFAKQHPITGGGFNAWPALTLSTGGSLDWHSSYIKILAEHGFVGLAIWLTLLLGTLFSLTRLGWAARHGEKGWIGDYCAMLRASLVAYAIGSLTLGIAYWELPYHLIVIASLLGWLVLRGNKGNQSSRAV